ncbi:MAG: hypothetical protein K1X74_22130 [Pirellulales bacterium]|nr:hypothetical protein [Pirellulales bacterium]
MTPNPVKQLLQGGRPVIGSEISRFRAADISRIYARAGFDFVFIDMEHTCFNLETVADIIEAARGAGIVPIVRVPQAEYVHVARVLDCGAQGIIVPRVNTVAEVQQIVSWTRYPPLGIRGYASTSAQTGGQPIGAEAFIEANHRSTLVVIQIERREAVENLSAMLAVDGVDVACLGLMDLSVDLGIPGQVDHPSMLAAVQRVVDVAREHRVASGVITACRETIARWVGQGVRFVSYATDEILLERAARATAADLRGLVAQEPSS